MDDNSFEFLDWITVLSYLMNLSSMETNEKAHNQIMEELTQIKQLLYEIKEKH